MDATTEPSDKAAYAEDIMHAVLIDGKTPAATSGIGPELLESIFDNGFTHYQAGRYQDALPYFSLLTMAEPLTKRYHMALGATWHQLNECQNALKAYGNALLIDPSDPAPSLGIGQCFAILGQTQEARDALQTAVEQSRSDPGHHRIAELASELLQTLR